MTYPAIPPGVIVPPTTALEQKVTELERKVEALSRRDLSNVVVGQGGTFRATLTAGGVDVLSIKPGGAAYGSKQQMTLRDQSGAVVYSTDELAGYGLSAPLYNYTLAVLYAGTSSGSNTAGTEYVVAECTTQFYNPAVNCKALLTMPGGVTWSARFIITDGGSTTISSSTTSYTSSQYVWKSLLLPASFIANQATKIQLLVTPGVTGSTVVVPGAIVGMAKSSYDVNPGIQ